jgi:hypothetical protein
MEKTLTQERLNNREIKKITLIPKIVKEIRSKRSRQAGCVVCIRETRNTHTVFVKNASGKDEVSLGWELREESLRFIIGHILPIKSH